MLKFFTSLLISGSLLLSACQDYMSPDKIYIENEPPRVPSPVITSIVPADSAIPGTYEIRILGANFTDVRDSIQVYFDGVAAQLKSISETELVIYHPGVVSDSTNITIAIPAAEAVARYSPYKFSKIRYYVSNFQNDSQGRMGPMEIDINDNLYISNTRRIIFKVSPEGVKTSNVIDNRDFDSVSDMKMGPGGLYVCVDEEEIYIVDVNTWENTEFITLPERVAELDFDENNVLYAGRRDGIYAVKQDRSFQLVGYENDFRISTIRVFNGYIYVYAWYRGDDESLPEFGLFKSEILNADGSLGPVLVEANLSDQGEFSAANLIFTHESFVIDEHGNFYFNNSIHPEYSILALRNGILEPLYNNTLTVPVSISNVVWGNGGHLYLNSSIEIDASVDEENRPRRVFSLDFGTTRGAPYYGRN
jgi:hypothetical protein